MRIALLYGVGVILFFCSCHQSPSRLSYRDVDGQGWLASDTLCFEIDSLSMDGEYLLSVGIRTSSAKAYPYRQMMLEVRQHWSSVAVDQIDTLNCELCKPDGEVTGEGVAVYSYEYPVGSYILHQGDSAKVYVRHLMRRSPLPGIYNVGILLQPVS